MTSLILYPLLIYLAPSAWTTWFNIALALPSVILAALGVAAARKAPRNSVVVVVLILALLIPVTFGVIFSPSDQSSDAMPLNNYVIAISGKDAVRITQPKNDDSVPQKTQVSGISQNISSGKKIVILLEPQKIARYYPQDYHIDNFTDGRWSTFAYLGASPFSDTWDRFNIIVALADKGAQNELNNYFETSVQNNSWPGLASLPSGLELKDYVTVNRAVELGLVTLFLAGLLVLITAAVVAIYVHQYYQKRRPGAGEGAN